MKYKLLITTSGTGSRLGKLTDFTNKSLLRIGKKPAISYIIEKYTDDIPVVVTLGYYGKHVKDFLELAYPKRNFEFVQVENYDGPGSSLVYSMLQAKDNLQSPFIFHACDTIVTEDSIPSPDKNWLAAFKSPESSKYRTLALNVDKSVHKINEKGAQDFDLAYIGVAGINDYKSFWRKMENVYGEAASNNQLSDCHALQKMLACSTFDCLEFKTWLDIGNLDDFNKARKNIDDKFEILDKLEESIYLFDDFVIKFFYDPTLALNRVERAKILKGITPEIIDSRDNFYKYRLAKGNLFASCVTEKDFSDFLEWCHAKLWIKHEASRNFREICRKFYYDKTKQRLEKLFKETSIQPGITVINGEEVPPVEEMLKLLDEDWLCNNAPYQFHGDFILDNIIQTENKSYVLLDWRQDFAGELEDGDIYYDLGKLNHNLVFNHDLVNRNLFTLKIKNDNIKCDILRSNILANCQDILFSFLEEKGFDSLKVKVISSIIWLNMAPLHHHPLNNFLFYFGKHSLWRCLKKTSKKRV